MHVSSAESRIISTRADNQRTLQRFQVFSAGNQSVHHTDCERNANASHPLSEVILAALLPTFHFAPSKQPISWTIGGVSGPVVEGSSQPTMPVVLSLAKGRNGA